MNVVGDQRKFAPHAICFGCGPANEKGLRINSYWVGNPFAGGEYVMEFETLPEHQAFPTVVNGGIIGTLLDCHSNWAAATAIMQKHGWAEPQCTVTADFHIKLKAPTPHPGKLTVRARILEIFGEGDMMAKVEAEIWAHTTRGYKITATCTGNFVVVKEGHPAYHRWG